MTQPSRSCARSPQLTISPPGLLAVDTSVMFLSTELLSKGFPLAFPPKALPCLFRGASSLVGSLACQQATEMFPLREQTELYEICDVHLFHALQPPSGGCNGTQQCPAAQAPACPESSSLKAKRCLSCSSQNRRIGLTGSGPRESADRLFHHNSASHAPCS